MAFEPLQREVRANIEELIATGTMHQAVELSAATGQRFNANQTPLFFVGDLSARLVVVYFNPYQVEGSNKPRSFEEYWESCAHFGERTYGPGAEKHRDRFDRKQWEFLRWFGAVDCSSLARFMDSKLQLELIPYGSRQFRSTGFSAAVLRPHIDRLLGVIAEVPRDYVLFCGRLFEEVFGAYVVERFRFRLTKRNGQPMRQSSGFATLAIPYQGRVIYAGLAPSFARQGFYGSLMAAYGQQCAALYPLARTV